MKISGIAALWFGLAWHAAAGAQAPPTLALSVERARQLAVAHSARHRETQASASAEFARARQVGAYPNPTAGLRREDTGSDRGGSDQLIVELGQPIDLGVTGRRRRAGLARAEAVAARADEARAAIERDVTAVYYRLLAAAGKLGLADRSLGAFDRALAISATRLAAGDVSGLAHRRLELEAARVAASRAGLALAAATEGHRLRSLIGLDSGGAVLRLTDSLPWPSEEGGEADGLKREAQERRPEIRSLGAELRAAEGEAAVERRARIPTPTVTAGFKTEVTGGQRREGLVTGLALSVPLFDGRRAALAAATEQIVAAGARLEAERRTVALEVTTAVETVRALGREHRLLATRLGPAADSAIAAAEVGLAEGELSVTEWLDAIRAYHEAGMALIGIRAEFAVEQTRLEWAAGRLGKTP